MTRKKKRQKMLSWMKQNHQCGCTIKFSKSGAIEMDKIILCGRHFSQEFKNWSPEDKLAYLIENLEVERRSIIWQLKHGIDDSCFHCDKEHAMSKHDILKQFVRLLIKIGTRDERIVWAGTRECPFCHKKNFLYCEIINFKGENLANWDYYPFPTKEHREAYMREMSRGNMENAQMYKPKGLRTTPKPYIV